MFVVAGLGEEGLEGSWVADVGIGIRSSIWLQAMLEKIADGAISDDASSCSSNGRREDAYSSQAALPS